MIHLAKLKNSLLLELLLGSINKMGLLKLLKGLFLLNLTLSFSNCKAKSIKVRSFFLAIGMNSLPYGRETIFP